MKIYCLILFIYSIVLEECPDNVKEAIQPKNVVGSGNSGTVYSLDEDNAFKLISSRKNKLRTFQAELDKLKLAQNVNNLDTQVTVVYKSDCEMQINEIQHFVIVMEKCQSTVQTLLRVTHKNDIPAMLGILKEAAKTVAVMVKNHFTLGDLHSENLMLCNGKIKVIDFGFVSYQEKDDQTKNLKAHAMYFFIGILDEMCDSFKDSSEDKNCILQKELIEELRPRIYKAAGNMAYNINDVWRHLEKMENEAKKKELKAKNIQKI